MSPDIWSADDGYLPDGYVGVPPRDPPRVRQCDKPGRRSSPGGLVRARRISSPCERLADGPRNTLVLDAMHIPLRCCEVGVPCEVADVHEWNARMVRKPTDPGMPQAVKAHSPVGDLRKRCSLHRLGERMLDHADLPWAADVGSEYEPFTVRVVPKVEQRRTSRWCQRNRACPAALRGTERPVVAQ